MTSNQYIASSFGFFVESASRISGEMTKAAVIQATLNFAIGMERLLKGVLFNVNPTYILVSPEFNHSLKVLYKEKIVESDDTKSILASMPTADVITFRNSLLRGAAVSRATQKNKNRLFGLSNLRDIIAHNDLELLDIEKSKLLLQRDFYFILLDFVDELNIDRTDCFGSYEESLIEVSRSHQQDIKNIIRLKLDEHRRVWEGIKDNSELVRKKTGVTDELQESEHRYETACPACNQRAVLFAEADYVIDLDNAEKRVVGEFARLIHCEFCGLHVNDDTELDELGYGKSFHPESFHTEFDDDIPF